MIYDVFEILCCVSDLRWLRAVKEAVLDFREQEEKELHSLSFTNSAADDSIAEVVKVTNQPIEEHDGTAEEDTPLN